mmetsp:Transcript_20957/g.33393  ORF Transcript_20957/g.33393 Transcript_20957/m.33393 type:complete len:220 (-) Transcript_20957:176-835(-)
MALTQPKKPAGGAFGIFSNEKRSEFAKACAGQPVTAVTKLASENWKKLSDKEKEPFQKKYELAKAKFEKDMAAFLASGGVKEKGAAALRTEKRKAKEGKLKKKKDPNAPKRPAGGAYGVYLSENRDKIVKSLPAGHKITDVAKAAGEQWKALSAAAKKPYEDKYTKKQAEYIAAMEQWKKDNPAEEDEDDDDDEVEEGEEDEEEPEEKPKAKKARKAGA